MRGRIRWKAVARDKAPKKTPFKNKAAKKCLGLMLVMDCSHRFLDVQVKLTSIFFGFGKEISAREQEVKIMPIREEAHASSNVLEDIVIDPLGADGCTVRWTNP
jgi:hypothetical protein